MNIRDLKYLVAVADYKHFGKAAKACFVSQPALSMQIKKLEKYLGMQLLERTNKSVLLTPIGFTMAERARCILHQIDEMREVAKSAKDPYSGELKLGIIPTLAPYLLPHIIPSLSESFPNLSIYLIEEQTSRLIKKLKDGKIDTAILALPVHDALFTSEPLFDEEFLLALPKQHPLAKRKIVKQNELENKKLLLLEDGHCLRDQALEICHLVNASESAHFRATSLETLRHMVASGIGMTLMPKLACQVNDDVVYVPFTTPKPKRTVGMVWRESTAKKIVLDDISSRVKKMMMKRKTLG